LSSATAAALVGLTVSATTRTARALPSQAAAIAVDDAFDAEAVAVAKRLEEDVESSVEGRERPSSEPMPD